jgi:hypothetical protein
VTAAFKDVRVFAEREIAIAPTPVFFSRCRSLIIRLMLDLAESSNREWVGIESVKRPRPKPRRIRPIRLNA